MMTDFEKKQVYSEANDGSDGYAEGNVPVNPKTEAEKLAKDWRVGTACVKDSNYTTESDRAKPKDFNKDLADIGEEPETMGGEKQ